MNKYRMIYCGEDDYSQYQCLACKKDFIQSDLSPVYIYCPHCGIRWESIFNKKNQRYNTYSVPPEYEMKNGVITKCFYPRLFLDGRRLTGGYTLSKDCFGIVETNEEWHPWFMIYNVRLGSEIHKKSSSVWIMQQLKLQKKFHDGLRVVLMTGSEKKIIKEWSGKDARVQV